MFPLIFSTITASLWVVGSVLFQLGLKRKQANILFSGGLVILLVFICYLWIHNQRPPLLTVGETRLWFSLFIVMVGYFSFLRWKSLNLLWASVAAGLLFLIINICHPESYEKVLLPILNSPWIWAHVLFCMAGYAILGSSCIIAFGGLLHRENEEDLAKADDHVLIGFGFLTIGLILGMIWAKEAWGHYWSWDPKLTLSFFTWLVYLSYLHYRLYRPHKIQMRLGMIVIIYGVLLFSWLGFFLLPASRLSIHLF